MDYDSDDEYIVDLESDQEVAADSSDDEIDIVLHGTPEQRRKLGKQMSRMDQKSPKSKKEKSQKEEEDSSEDEFEKEMAADLDSTMKMIEQKHKSAVTAGSSTSQRDKPSSQKPECYDNTYFDSDSDDEGTTEEKKTRKRPILSNDDLLYDPNADNDDQRWVDNQRRRYQPHKSQLMPPTGPKPPNKAAQRLPNSDAVLNCPACMVQLCLDCQRHETYNNQYRAMFVMNCSVNYEQRLKFPKHKRQQSKKKKKMDESQRSQTEDPEDSENYHPVKCSQCTTEVGVLDTDEVFHFFNVLASHS